MKKLFSIFVILVLSPIFNVFAEEDQRPNAIYHAFNMRYEDIQDLLPMLAVQGYSHIQISPSQYSRDVSFPRASDPIDEVWWLRYQPVDYLKLDNWMGNQEDLENLTRSASAYGIKIIADVVFNHVAVPTGLENIDWKDLRDRCYDGKDCKEYLEKLSYLSLYPNFSMAKCFANGLKEDFLNDDWEAKTICMEDFHEWSDCGTAGLTEESKCWLFGDLPDLKPSENVLETHKKHMQMLLDSGVMGFRFDSAANLEPTALKTYLAYLKDSPQKPYYYLEYVNRNDNDMKAISKTAPVLDYPFFTKLEKIFSEKGNLDDFKNLGYLNKNNVVFSENHETFVNRDDKSLGHENQIANPRDVELATSYILARNGSAPIILNKLSQSRGIPEGVFFRATLAENSGFFKKPEHIYNLPNIDSKHIMIMSRNDGNGFYILNRTDKELELDLSEILDGDYLEVLWRDEIYFKKPNDLKMIKVEAKSPAYFVKKELVKG